ncbi:exported hypothetical protein [uncultured Pleomorphomonas sp.]|uniref:Uncharacterized protein n=2 Tax=Pleomorphomonas TaxID=261933 RepID=A0A2G9WRJ4_9HYPH|nr:hypothetical protein [Pleomorphomonas carboxyditropha]PIO97337.1 hypothetical protein CJ014_21260 [Pleomorphomonas carboxyditropha]SCM71092.1 exported hypothetical protein [uncultured Pleomorphomonas sp.]
MIARFLAAAAVAAALVPAVANAGQVYFDPSVDSGSSPFIELPTHVNPANAAAAAADAQRYATVAGDAVIGTHGAPAQAVTEYDPGASSGDPAFVTKLVVPNPANAEAAARDAARLPSVAYADNGDLIGN